MQCHSCSKTTPARHTFLFSTVFGQLDCTCRDENSALPEDPQRWSLAKDRHTCTVLSGRSGRQHPTATPGAPDEFPPAPPPNATLYLENRDGDQEQASDSEGNGCRCAAFEKLGTTFYPRMGAKPTPGKLPQKLQVSPEVGTKSGYQLQGYGSGGYLCFLTFLTS